ncbi:MAG: RnfABCDGE type electron transport complex subunit G [Candidatus Syntrophosphaera sp.]|nr:RnfABCDGE type electron transport complex subunit G [Candidatus Syntrophosphaera sp.]
MRYYLKLGLILLLFCAVATGILAYVNSITRPRIDQLKAKQEMEARQFLIPGAEFDRVAAYVADADSLVYFIARNPETNQIKGYTFTAAKAGYSSTVKTMAAVDNDFNVINIQIVEQAETPGLGANCTKPEFTGKFKGLAIDQVLVDKDGGGIASLTGATITSRAIASSLKEQILAVQKDVEAKLAEREVIR